MIAKDIVYKFVEEKLSDGMFIVDVTVGAGNAISIVIDSDNGLSIDKCIEVSRYVEHQFDREVDDFSLEVSSPGLTQPFKVLRQYLKNLGKEVEIVTNKGEKLKGILKSAHKDGFTIETRKSSKIEGKKTEELINISFSNQEIKTVKSIITFK